MCHHAAIIAILAVAPKLPADVLADRWRVSAIDRTP
jgi:hypothetical protein